MWHPRGAASNDRIGEDQQLSSAGGERNLVFLSGRPQAVVEVDELGVPTEGRCQRGCVQAVAQPLTASRNVSNATPVATVVVIGSKPGQCCSLLTTDAADLRHPHQDDSCGAQRDTVDAGDQVEPLGEIAVLADRRDQLLELLAEKPAQSLDFLLPELPQMRITARLAIVLEREIWSMIWSISV